MSDRAIEILHEAKILAQEYQDITDKPLGVTGEIAEYEAAQILGLKLTPARQAGYDATEERDGIILRVQIKGRRVLSSSSLGKKLGRLDKTKDWDSVLLVLLDKDFNTYEIYEAMREEVVAALNVPGSKARNEKGTLNISKFKSIAKLRWQKSPT